MRKLPFGFLIILLLAACSRHQVRLEVQAPATFPAEPRGYEIATVTRVIDGDTIEVLITDRVSGPGAGDTRRGARASVRLVGIDTPETVDPRRQAECFGKEATAASTALLGDQSVKLVKDVEETDDFGRLLRYVYVGQEMVNARLVVNGYASAYTYPPNVRHASLLVALQRQAHDARRGLWEPRRCGSSPSPGM